MGCHRATRLVLAVLLAALVPDASLAQRGRPGRDRPRAVRGARQDASLAYTGRRLGKVDQIEVGGPYAGVELHQGSPLPTRLSFFYPVQTNIDRCPNYWKRADYPVMKVGLRVGREPVEMLGKGQFNCEKLTPYSVKLRRRDPDKEIHVSYQFSKTRPATIVTYTVKNTSDRPRAFSLSTELMTSTVRSSHAYNEVKATRARVGRKGSALYTYFSGEAPDTCLFVGNAGQRPSRASCTVAPAPGTRQAAGTSPVPGASAFSYDRVLAPGQKLRVVQVIGTARSKEAPRVVRELSKHHRRDVRSYERHVRARVARTGKISTGDRALDHSARISKAILAANEHYIDGKQVPMPCSAEYPYKFTHDILMKNMAATIFDPKVVKRDLKAIADKATRDGIIPHATYWKKDRYVTEYAKPDNWIHFWFTLVSSRYLRHTGDKKLLARLYPMLRKSVQQMLVNHKDGLVSANRPDWWDIGDSFGPRSYMTILATRALREFLYVSTVLGKGGKEVRRCEKISTRMQRALGEKLWDKRQRYLVNYNAGDRKDPHYYTGSMLAAHFGLLDQTKQRALMETARAKLVDPKVGVYNAFPMDFGHKKQRAQFKFNGDEAGERHKYMNGGIWYHGNAWYALGLMANGQQRKARSFVKRVMTVDGILKGPNGQPAMYECRSGDAGNPAAYGKVDKPQFLWAASWYLYTLYNLMGLRENEWNISFSPTRPTSKRGTSYSMSLGGKPVTVKVKGSGETIRSITCDGKPLASAVVPHGLRARRGIEIRLGRPESPYVAGAASLLLSSSYDARARRLTARLEAFAGHRNRVILVSPTAPRAVLLDGKPLDRGSWRVVRRGGVHSVEVEFSHRAGRQTLDLQL